MAGFFDYLDWRGGLSFAAAPLNEVDNTILCEVAHMDWDGIVPGPMDGGRIPLCEAVEKYCRQNPGDEEKPLGLIVPAKIKPLVRRMADTARFGGISLLAYTNRLDLEAEEQFAAITVAFPESGLFIAFRGTDDTLVGWKENLNMGLYSEVPAQRDAVAYLNLVATLYPDEPIWLGGHSKGGNLAIYAAVGAEAAVRTRIRKVWSNDGPGFSADLIHAPSYAELYDRIESIVPETSIIGRMLEHDGRFTAVRCGATGLWQHDAFNWEVLGDAYVHVAGVSAESNQIDLSLKSWMNAMSEEEKSAFVESVYGMLTATGATTLLELTHDLNWFWRVLTEADPADKKRVFSSLAQMTGEAGRVWIERILPFLGKNTGNRTYSTLDGSIADSKVTTKTGIAEAKKTQKTTVQRTAETISRQMKESTDFGKRYVRKTGHQLVCGVNTVCKKAAALADEFVSVVAPDRKK